MTKQQQNQKPKNRPLKFDIMFWDCHDPKTIVHLSVEQAWMDNHIEFKGDTLVPTDCSTIISQSTGLTDKNGNEIFEGDIVQHDSWNYPFTVVFNKEKARFVCELRGVLTHYIDNERIKVIGNIYENPELVND